MSDLPEEYEVSGPSGCQANKLGLDEDCQEVVVLILFPLGMVEEQKVATEVREENLAKVSKIGLVKVIVSAPKEKH